MEGKVYKMQVPSVEVWPYKSERVLNAVCGENQSAGFSSSRMFKPSRALKCANNLLSYYTTTRIRNVGHICCGDKKT